MHRRWSRGRPLFVHEAHSRRGEKHLFLGDRSRPGHVDNRQALAAAPRMVSKDRQFQRQPPATTDAGLRLEETCTMSVGCTVGVTTLRATSGHACHTLAEHRRPSLRNQGQCREVQDKRRYGRGSGQLGCRHQHCHHQQGGSRPCSLIGLRRNRDGVSQLRGLRTPYYSHILDTTPAGSRPARHPTQPQTVRPPLWPAVSPATSSELTPRACPSASRLCWPAQSSAGDMHASVCAHPIAPASMAYGQCD